MASCVTTLFSSFLYFLHFHVSFCIKGDDGFYSFKVKDISGTEVPLRHFSGMVTLVVNVASECGYTDGHYRSLVKLQKMFTSSNKFTVLAFPCNQFGEQEPKGNADIKLFAENNYAVNFPIFAKVNVKGHDVPEAWRFLIENSGQVPTWNFFKYLVSPAGLVLNAWGPWVSVEEIVPYIKIEVNKALGNTDPMAGIHKPEL